MAGTQVVLYVLHLCYVRAQSVCSLGRRGLRPVNTAGEATRTHRIASSHSNLTETQVIVRLSTCPPGLSPNRQISIHPAILAIGKPPKGLARPPRAPWCIIDLGEGEVAGLQGECNMAREQAGGGSFSLPFWYFALPERREGEKEKTGNAWHILSISVGLKWNSG